MRQIGDSLPSASEAARDHVDGGGHADEDHGAVFLRVVHLRYARHGHLRHRKEQPVGAKVERVVQITGECICRDGLWVWRTKTSDVSVNHTW